MKLSALLWILTVASAAIVGLDFGHQNTKAMIVAPGIPFEIIFTDDGKRKDDSSVFVKPKIKDGALYDAERAYGSQIGSLCSRFPESCAANLKALIGKSYDHEFVKEYLKSHTGAQLLPSNERENAIAFELGRPPHSHPFSVEELAGMSLARIKESVLKALVLHPQAMSVAEDVAVSVPPFAGQLTRLAYLDALHFANFSSVLGLVDEGTATALGYLSAKKFKADEYNDKEIHEIIYDMGAGSTSATLFSYTALRNKTIILDIESVGHDETLGGDLLTQQVYGIIRSKFLENFNLDPGFELTPRMSSRLTQAAEKAKTILSANSDYVVSLETFYDEHDLKVSISRTEFEDAARDLIDRVNGPILDALSSSVKGPKTIADIDHVILNGGATRSPFVQKQLINLLGDESKIAKVLNTDEACVYGTTVRAYQLKMITNSVSDIILKDRIFADYEISIGNLTERIHVFDQGSLSGISKNITLSQRFDEELVVGLYENGILFGNYTIPKLSTKSSDLGCPNEELELIGEFSMDKNKIFSLSNVSLSCSKDVPLQSLDQTSNSTNDTKSTFQKLKSQVKVPNIVYTSLRPFTKFEKTQYSRKLKMLKEREKEKLAFEFRKNVLESGCYRLRTYIDDHFDILAGHHGKDKLEQFQSEASEIVDWVEYELDSSDMNELESKLEYIDGQISALEKDVKMLSSDLSLEPLKALLKEGNELAEQVQEYLLEFGTQINKIRGMFDSEELDFDSVNKKIMKKLYGNKMESESELSSHYESFKQALKDLSDLVNLSSKEFENVSTEAKFQKSELVSDLVYQMMADATTLKKKHEERISYLLLRLEKLKEKKRQSELRKKLKEESSRTTSDTERLETSAAESGETESTTLRGDDTTSAITQTTDLSETNVEETSQTSEAHLGHDEL